MSDKYVWCKLKSSPGLNDCFSQITYVIDYCKKNNRILLLDMTHSPYAINFSDYFHILICECNIIYDIDKIKDILKNKPSLNPNLLYSINELPHDVNEDIILHCPVGGGNGFYFFKQLGLTEKIKSICIQKMNLLENYLCIHVRNTDYKCDYPKLYEDNKEKIHSYDQIYICTDDESVITFFKSKHLNVFCFTTFPTKSFKNLHTSNVSKDIKIQDLLVDIFIATNSKELLSNSKGGFIKLLRDCFNNKKCVLDKLL